MASQILNGKKLYIDFFDPNPPLIFYYSMLPVLLSKFSGLDLISSSHIIDIYLAILCIFITIFTFRYTKYANDKIFSNLFAFTACAAIFIIPLCSWANSFFNKDVMVVPFMLPYLLLSLNRLENRTSRPHLLIKIIIGIMAGFAFSIKPFFVIIFIITELIIYQKNKKIEFRKNIEILVAAFFIATYTLSIFLLTPEYITDTLPIIQFTHPLFTNKPIILLLFFSSLMIVPLASLILANIVKSCEFIRFFSLIAMLLTIIALLQNKGWVYQVYPAIAMGYIVISKIIADIITGIITNSPNKNTQSKTPFLKYSFIVIILIIVSYGGMYKSYERFQALYNSNELQNKYSINIINKIVNKSEKNKPNILILSEYLHHSYPAIYYGKGETFFSLPFLFPLTAIENYKYINEIKSNEQIKSETKLVREFMLNQINSYIRKYKPDIIISRNYINFSLRWEKRDIDIIKYLKNESSEFTNLMKNYLLDDKANNIPYDAYYRKYSISYFQ